jgi:hypothetical protein
LSCGRKKDDAGYLNAFAGNRTPYLDPTGDLVITDKGEVSAMLYECLYCVGASRVYIWLVLYLFLARKEPQLISAFFGNINLSDGNKSSGASSLFFLTVVSIGGGNHVSF